MSTKSCVVWDETLVRQCDRLPAVSGRASIVHELMTAYGLLQQVKLVRSTAATDTDIKLFHAETYLDHLKTFRDVDEEYMTNSEDEEYGFGYDCEPISDMYNVVSTIAGGSITAAKCLLLGLTDTVINWCGGWHHAHRFGAEGFCYINDIVLAIEYLRKKFSRILYVDLDVHHGNGVQDAYNLSKSVFTLSFHKFEPGFYPGTGNIDDIGIFEGKGYTCNFPLNAAYSDETLEYCFDKVFNSVCSHFMPDVIVVQCGADCLARDPHGGGGVTPKGYSTCIRHVLNKRKPTMFVGGGGYNFTNTAKLWTILTALIIGVELDNNIPEHKFWPKYGPEYSLEIQPLMMKDLNTKEYIDECISTIQGNLSKYLGGLTDASSKNNKQTGIKCGNNNSNIRKSKFCYEKESKVNADNNNDVYEFDE